MARATSTDNFWSRRRVLCAGGSLLLLVRPAMAASKFAEVWKDPNCGCCKDWVTHLEADGFKVKVNDIGNEGMRAKLGVDPKYGSCHTALIDGYAIEGHVPVREIRRLLKERPTAIGLAVPGMPIGSPGMDGGLHGNRKDSYNVMSLGKNASATIYQRYERNKS